MSGRFIVEHEDRDADMRKPRAAARRTLLLTPCAALLVAGFALPPEPGSSGPSDARAASRATAAATAGAPSPDPGGSALKQIDPAALQAAMERAAEALMVPGAMVLLRTPQGTFRASVGTTELGAADPPAAGTHFRIASNTKTLTSALVLLLAQEGRLRLADPVSDYVPGVPNGRNITVEQLLKMRSGLYNYTDAPELSASLDVEPAKARTPQEMLAIAFSRPPNFPPGTAYEYSNTNYALLGLVAEKAGGQPLERQFRERLTGPLALKGTSLPGIRDTSLPAPSSHGYMYGGTAYALTDKPYPADVRRAAESGKLKPLDYTRQNPSYAYAAGGAVSTAEDLATWIRSLTTGKVLNPAFQKQWLDSPQAEDPAAPEGQKYGYGIAYQRFNPKAAMYFHGGELPGFNSFMGHDPDNDVTLVVWTNLTLSPDGRTTANSMLPTILNQVYAGLSLPGAH
ncbi:serine hydrolase domain-containing protein [Streptomyces erythrochromogenes]|uniref:serine hydrolase domain-containing protein n=1 Tax=Streptomyces erythrochromogenes TaxID=285574 RepID=UPI003688A1D6